MIDSAAPKCPSVWRRAVTIVAALAAALAGMSTMAAADTPPKRATAGKPQISAGAGNAARFAPVLVREGRSRPLCEAESGRVFVSHGLGTACVAYFVTRGWEKSRRAVVFFDGDVTLERFADPAAMTAEKSRRNRWLQAVADKYGVRIVQVSRLGVEGSSGNHGDRRKPGELATMDHAIDAIKTRLGIDDIVLAGQSGGATIAASLLTLGRNDVACAVLGSGAYELAAMIRETILQNGRQVDEELVAELVYDPSRFVSRIPDAAHRRVFVLADRADSRTPFDQQQRFANHVRGAGHHARLFAIHGTGAWNHGATAYAVPLAALCARGAGERELEDALEPLRRQIEDGAVRKRAIVEAQPAPTSQGARTTLEQQP